MRYLITSALPYINGIKHLGNLAGSMLPADVYARFLRASGRDVLFICATDEHGTPAELAAEEAGMDVADFCAEQHALQAEVCAHFGLSFDHFGRSSSLANRELTQHFAARLEAHGYVEERITQQMYSHHDGRFLPDRYVIGTCPHCGYTRARGDQCENCTRLLDAGELIEPRSATSGSTDVQLRETRHLFLLQSKLAPELREWLTAKDGWPPLARSIGLKWLDEGLEDRGITRDLDWGVPVERPGFENKVFYVWFDAPIEYIAATREWAEAHSLGEAWRSWWFDVADVHYTQFMAKDNVPFHTVGFPATIIGSREPWKLVDFLKAFNWLTYYGGKFSTSQGVGVFMSDALELLPPDYWRYYLTAHAPESDDSAFSWEALSIAVNKDLADTLGNFVNRSLRFAAKHWGAVVPPGGEPADAERDLESALDERVAAYGQFLERLELRKAMAVLRDIWSLGNAYLDRKKPWATVSTDRADTAVTLRTAANLAVLFARLSTPVIPGTADRIFEHLGVPAHERGWPTGRAADAIQVLAPDHPIEVPPVLFRKLTDDDVATWRQRFGGGMPADG